MGVSLARVETSTLYVKKSVFGLDEPMVWARSLERLRLWSSLVLSSLVCFDLPAEAFIIPT